MNIGIIIQARLGSTRLPRKILLPFYQEYSLIEVLLKRLHEIKEVSVIVATSINEIDDELASFLKSKNEIVYRGSEEDVLRRFIDAAVENHINGIVRICSDNPFIDINGIKLLVDKAKESEVDYIGFKINDKPSILTHFGFWGEFVRLDALQKVYATTEIGSPAHEHVTYHIYSSPNEYICEWINAPEYLEGRDDIRLTVDTKEDFQNAQNVYMHTVGNRNNFLLQDVINYLNEHQDIKESMKNNIVNNKKQ